jgi:hypothetical protein
MSNPSVGNVPAAKTSKGGVRFGQPELTLQLLDPGMSGATTTGDMDGQKKAPSSLRGVAFQESALRTDGCGEGGVAPSPSSMEKKKSQFSRFLEGKGMTHGGSISPSKAARKTFGNLQAKRKSMSPTPSPTAGSPDAKVDQAHWGAMQTRKTFGTVQSPAKFGGDDDASEPILEVGERGRVGRGERGVDEEDGASKYKKRSRSASRGPRRGRDRFRGMGVLFSTSKTRNAPRPPRATVDEKNRDGTSGKVLLTLLRSRRMASPSPERLSAASSSERRSDLLKCRSADVAAVLHSDDR